MIICGGKAIIGDGKTIISNAYIRIRRGMIVDVASRVRPDDTNEMVVNSSGALIIPGIINTHAHALVPGPLFPIGKVSFSFDKVRDEHNRHLIAGETSALNLCGFCLQTEIESIKDTPLNVKAGTSHLPASFEAARLVDGAALSEAHRRSSARQRLNEGAVAIGEIGAGWLLGGGGQDYDGIPRAIERVAGIWLRPDQARELKWAVLGKNLSLEAYDAQQTTRLLDSFGLSSKLSALEVQKIISDSVLTPLSLTIRGYEQAAALSAETNRPAVLHNCPFVVAEIARLAQKYPRARLVAAHSNQADFEIEEAVEWAGRLRDLGVIVDVSTWDCPGKAIHADPIKFTAMLAAGVVDTVSTDYAAGEWEPIIKGLALAVKAKAINLAKAVSLATGNVANLLPEVADGKGVIASGKPADLVLVEEEDIGVVRSVIVNGEFVVENGQMEHGD